MTTFSNGESGLSVRNKINDAINKVDGVSEITCLNVNGTIKLDGNYPVGAANVALGDGALDDAGLTGASNTAVGACALTANTSGGSNTATGQNVLSANTTGGSNTAMGVNALLSNTTASNNVAFGASAMRCNTTGSSNTALGINALCANVEGDQSVAVGINALQNQNPVGNADMNNVAVGYLAAQCTTTGVPEHGGW
jgi:trimeric autotransporter adhesin